MRTDLTSFTHVLEADIADSGQREPARYTCWQAGNCIDIEPVVIVSSSSRLPLKPPAWVVVPEEQFDCR